MDSLFYLCSSEFRIDIEEGIEALLELGFNLFTRALKHVHGDVCLIAISKLKGSVVDLDDFALGEEAHSVDKSQICHEEHLIRDRGNKRKRERFEEGMIRGVDLSLAGPVLYNLLGNSWQRHVTR